jgi:hypothetical protein
VYAKQCPRCQTPNGPTTMVCTACHTSLKGIPLTHGESAEAPPQLGRRWDLAIFILLGGGLLTALAVMLCGWVEQAALGIGLGMITAALTVLMAALAAAPLKPVDEDRGWGTGALFVLLFLVALLVVTVPVIGLATLYSLFR